MLCSIKCSDVCGHSKWRIYLFCKICMFVYDMNVFLRAFCDFNMLFCDIVWQIYLSKAYTQNRYCSELGESRDVACNATTAFFILLYEMYGNSQRWMMLWRHCNSMLNEDAIMALQAMMQLDLHQLLRVSILCIWNHDRVQNQYPCCCQKLIIQFSIVSDFVFASSVLFFHGPRCCFKILQIGWLFHQAKESVGNVVLPGCTNL